MHIMTWLAIRIFLYIPEAIFNARAFKCDTNVVVNVTCGYKFWVLLD